MCHCRSFFVQEQSRSDTEKLIADMTSLVSNHIRRQMDLVCFLFLLLSVSFLWGRGCGEDRKWIFVLVVTRFQLLFSLNVSWIVGELAGRCKAC